ncbi:MAG: heme-binding protein, partial [Planctomycetaceae bacterium]|nr:heme-binding protein [Planctomycetaceae bacterium]
MLLFSCGNALAQQPRKQSVERQPSLERGAVPEKPAASLISDGEFSKGPVPAWIWGEDNNQSYVLKTTFVAGEIRAARLIASCDNVGTVFINGKQVATSSEWQQPMSANVAPLLQNGENTITANVSNQGGVAAFVLKLVIQDRSGELLSVVTNADWMAESKDEVGGRKASLRATYGDGPWGSVFNSVGEGTRVPNGTFEVPPGFVVDKLFTVPKDELGSWVCIAFDNNGRLLASDQGDKGICRITLPAVEGSGETIVERLDFSKCEFKPSGAQGMLWAFDSLYFCCNGGPGSGLYRARDNDGDDQFDECVKLKEFRGGGEHGPHSIRLSPDGKRIFVIAGNHTQPPF